MEQVNSIDDYKQKLSRYDALDNIYFRGQLEKYSNITSSISRDKGYTKNEKYIYEEAISMKSEEFSEFSLPIERLAKMQHYGIPTRLVDLTVDPLRGLFFAVQDVKCESPGNVYIFIQQGYPFDNKRIKLLSLLATIDSLSIASIQNSYYRLFKEKITKNEILNFVSKGVFINYSEELQEYNRRLYSQKGTFAICGNRVVNNSINRSILPLDSIEPTMIIRIPYEYKEAIKNELDSKYNINETTIYPEFQSVAQYLKEKYNNVNYNLAKSYSIIQSQDVSHAGARRISVEVVLNKALPIDEVKRIGIKVVDINKNDNDVVWVYIAKNSDDYIMKNWIVRAQWIRKSLEDKFKPLQIGEMDDDGYIWDLPNSYSTLTDYYNEHVFSDDKILYVQNMRTFEEVEPYYDYMLETYESGNKNDFNKFVKDNSSIIRSSFMKFGNYGYSRDDEFNEYLRKFQETALWLDDIVLWLEKENLSSLAKKHEISKCLNKAKENIDIIHDKASYWKHTIDLTDEEYKGIDLKKIERKEYQYKQTIPINSEGVDVAFNLNILQNRDNTINIKGTTNLFDKSSLMISLRNAQGTLLAQNKSLVENGQFDFGRLGKEDTSFKEGNYEVQVLLSIPSTQDKEFVQKAGTEYENLIGKYIDRTGIGPIVRFTEEFKIRG